MAKATKEAQDLFQVFENTKYIITVFVRISAAALINFSASHMRRLFEGGAYSNKYGIYKIYKVNTVSPNRDVLI